MKKILFPTDFSRAADNAFRYALEVADHEGAEITTVHVYELPELHSSHLPNTLKQVYDSITLETFENYRDNVPHLRKIAQDEGKTHLRIQHMMIDSKRQGTVNGISHTARTIGADMIIMGTTGASGIKEVFLGSVAAEVMENAPCAVLAVPVKAKYDGNIDRIAVTVEYGHEDEQTCRYVLAFAGHFDAEVVCLHVDVSHTENINRRMEKLKEKLGDDVKMRFEVIDHTSIEKALAKDVEQPKVDILAMHIRKRNFFQELFSYSMTKRLAYHLEIPILAIHNGPAKS